MFKRKKYIRLAQISASPKSADLKKLLFESDSARGCTVEMPWCSEKTGLRYSITVCHEPGGSEPIWSLYQGEGAQSRMIWTQAFKDPELLSDVIILSLPAEAAPDSLAEKFRANDGNRIYDPRVDRSQHTYAAQTNEVELLSMPSDTPLPEKPESAPFGQILMTEADLAQPHSSLTEPGSKFPGTQPGQTNGSALHPAIPGAFPISPDALLQGENPPAKPLPATAQPSEHAASHPENYNPAFPPQAPAYQGHLPGNPPSYPPGYPGGYQPGYVPPYPPGGPGAYPQGHLNPGYPQYPPGYVVPPGYQLPPEYPAPHGYAHPQYSQAQQGSVMVPRVNANSDLIAKRPNVLLGDFLVETGLIPATTLDAALQLQEMVRNGSLSTTQAAEAVRRAHKRGGEVEQFSPSAPPADSSGARINAPPLGEILVEAGLIRISILKAALNLQEVIRTGALSKEEAVEAFIQEHFGKAGKQGTGESSHDQNILELFIKAKLIQPGDLEAAIAVKKKHGGEVSKILESAGKLDRITYEAAARCQTLLEEKRLKIEQAIIALHYCQRSRVTFDDAIEELGWEKP